MPCEMTSPLVSVARAFDRKFADNVTKAKKGKGASDATKRFCVECGIAPPGEWTGYSPDAHIQIQGVHHVVCLYCKHFATGMLDTGGRRTPFCHPCRTLREKFRIGPERREEEHRLTQERRRLKEEQAQRREATRPRYGSDYEDSDDGPEPSPTWSELRVDLVQAEWADEF